MKRFAYLPLIAAATTVALCVPIIRELPTTTYGGASPWRLWLEGSAAISLAAGSLAQLGGRRNAFLGVIGATWLIPELAGWLSGPASLAAIADAWSRLLVALVVVAFVPRVRSPILARGLVVGTVAAGALGAVSRLVLVDPFLEISCWRRCDTNPLAVSDAPVGTVLDHVSAVLVAGSAVACGCLGILDRRRGRKRGIAAMDVAVAAFVAGTVAPAVLRVVGAESATATPFVTCWVVAQLGALGIAAAIGCDRVMQWLLRARLVRLAVAFGSVPGALTAALRAAVRDPDLEIRYWAASRSRYVDSEGIWVDPPRGGENARLTFVERRGVPVAAIAHRPGVDSPRLERALGPALRLTLENEQLRAAALAELRALNRSRIRVVERATLERHRLERNLHDGAQQRVVSVVVMTRMVAQRIARTGCPDSAAAALAHRAEALAQATVDELRSVARGIYPAMLADAGLAGAILELAESSSDLAVRVSGVPTDRYPGIVESTAYVVVAAAVADARERGASVLDFCGRVVDDVLICSLVDDATAGPGPSVTNLADRVRALSGTLAVSCCPTANRMSLELPCGS